MSLETGYISEPAGEEEGVEGNERNVEGNERNADLEALDAYKRGRADSPIIYKPYGWCRVASDAGQQKDMMFVASEESADRVGDVIKTEGWVLENFKRNPVLMYSHDYSIPVLGTIPNVWTEKKQLLNTVRWDDEDPFARFIKGKYERGFMKAVSVGFKAIDFEEQERGILFKQQELLEISLVPVPMHPRALKKGLMGLQSSLWLSRLWQDVILPEVSRELQEPHIVNIPIAIGTAVENTNIDLLLYAAREIKSYTKEKE